MTRITMTAALLVALAAPACSDDGPANNPDLDGGSGLPDKLFDTVPVQTLEVKAGKTTLKILTSPLTLTLLRESKVLSTVTTPVGVGTVKSYDKSRFYDPADPKFHGVTWTDPAHAMDAKVSKDKVELVLQGGIKLTASVVPGADAVRLDLEALAADDKSAAPQTAMTRLCLGVVDKEVFFGFGELFDTVSSRGVIRPMQLLIDTRSPSGTNENHAPIPLAISPRGWSMLVDSFHAGAFDVARSTSDRICAAFTTHKMSTVLTTADQPLDLVRAVVKLKQAPPALPPAWAFAPQQWRNALKDQTELLDDAKTMRAQGIPGSTVWIDNPWQTGYNTHLFDTKQFPDAKGTIAKLNAMGYRVLVWSTPFVNTNVTALYAEGDKNGYLAKDTSGKTWAHLWSNGTGSMVDFSAPGTEAWWQKNIKKVTDLGISGFKLDYGEEGLVALGAGRHLMRFYGGRDTSTMHREYPGLYHKAYLGVFNKGEGFLITRAGALGEQKTNTCIWPGDLDNDMSKHTATNVGGLPAAISGMLSLSASGYPFFGSDIGGYRGGAPDAETLMRWAEYAALGTIMQLGGAGKSHNPWDTTLYGTEALPHYRTYARLHMDLFPYIYSYAVQAAKDGSPVTVPLGLAFPADQKAWTQDFEYMLGDHVLVAPVITPGAKTKKVYLPAGTWVHHWTRKAYLGGAEVTVDAPLGKLPLFVREGGIIAMLGEKVDTLAPASDSTVKTYAANKEKLKVAMVPGGGTSKLDLFDGTQITLDTAAAGITVEIKAGTQFKDPMLSLDWKNYAGVPKVPAKVTLAGKALTQAAKAIDVKGCAGGCWYYDATDMYLEIQVAGAGKVSIM